MTKRKINVLFSPHPILLLLLIATAIGYGQTPTATLSGVVSAGQGEVVRKATVTVKNSATGKSRQGTTGENGQYIFTLLDPGIYELQVQADGFKLQIQKNLVLNVGGSNVRDVQLEVGGITDQVVIEVKDPLTDPNRVDIS